MAYRRLRELKGIGEKTEQLFERLGVFSVDDLVHYYPRDYEIYDRPVPFGQVIPGQKNVIAAVVSKTPSVRRFGGNSITMLQVTDGTGSLQLNWFHMPYLRTQLKPGMRKIFRGLVIEKQNRLIMEHPQIFEPEAYAGVEGQMLPVYALTAGLSNQMLRKTVRQVLAERVAERDYLPEQIRQSFGLWEMNQAIPEIHFPESRAGLLDARHRLIFDEFFLFLLGVSMLKKNLNVQNDFFRMHTAERIRQVISSLPYEMTEGQKNVWQDIERDLTGGTTMNRLVQGDVGSGKTILAFLAMILTMENGLQSALMVPTEVLAQQHYAAMRQLLQDNQMDPECVVLLTGSCTAAEKREIYSRIEENRISMIIGTHALFQEKVTYANLALVITDEQHRFGVRQRGMLSEKGAASADTGRPSPHVLVMSATPIPRTLAMILYGDLDISALHELPARRARIKNAVVDTSYRPAAYQFFRKQIAAGHQIYVICPMVEPNEEIQAENVTEYSVRLQKEMGSGIKVQALHGQMKPAVKNEIMQAFAENKIQILVSTTVIEVGINVPNATVMMIENAERFGLAQLHQLRGRVGRGRDQSYCIFVQGQKGPVSERLKILQESNDGFHIAEEDLKLRGPGDLFGVRQSGLAFLNLADIYRDQSILQEAYQAVREILESDPHLEKDEYLPLQLRLHSYIRQQNDDIFL
ncbi:MAG: ATP-dependent DNA helicase RecG [Eubacterium sp.]|nr:ATP-dependent DNA helicase RecG [Eubacterium sp.]